MLNFIKKFITGSEKSDASIRNDPKNEHYFKLLSDFLSDGILDENEKRELKEFAETNNIKEEELLTAHKKAGSLLFQNISSDGKITDDEKRSLEELLSYFNVRTEDFNFDQKAFNKFYALGLIDKGILPNIKDHDVDVVFKKGEILHWACPGALRKYKNVINRVNYGGPAVSIKIMKGVRYRFGSVGFSTQSTEHLINEDVGSFFITNSRIGFRGERKNFAVPLSKVYSFQLTPAGLEIVKEGKETPYIIGLEDYDVPCMMISQIINNN